MNGPWGSEFTDEYQDWLEGNPGSRRAAWFDVPVSELGPGPFLKVAPTMSLHEVVTLMNEHHRGAALVVRGDELLGIFTERDVLRRVVLRDLDLKRMTVSDLMTQAPDVLPEWATIAQALRIMSIGGYRHLPVVDALGRPRSMVSMRSIIDYVSEKFPKEVLNAPPEKPRYAFRSDGG